MLKNYKNKKFWRKSLCNDKSTLKDILFNLHKSGLKIALIHKNQKLIGTVTDGDIRKALLVNKKLDTSILEVLNRNPKIIKEKENFKNIYKKMIDHNIDHLPEVNGNKKITNLYVRNQVKNIRENLFIIMAGGFGKRLKPYTNKLPKPLLKVKKKEIIKYTLDQAIKNNFSNFLVTTYYKRKLIKDFLKKNFNLSFLFTEEKKPLGTAGPLSLISKPKTDFIVCNGDIITNIDFEEVLSFHNKNNAEATIVLKKIKTTNPYGEVSIDGFNIGEIYEKKITEQFAIAGIYVFSPNVLKYLKKGKKIDMISFLNVLKSKKKKIIGFPAHENWIEMGILENFKKTK